MADDLLQRRGSRWASFDRGVACHGASFGRKPVLSSGCTGRPGKAGKAGKAGKSEWLPRDFPLVLFPFYQDFRPISGELGKF